MILYEANPKLKQTVVTTVMGDKEYRRNCKYIKGKYYRVDRDCFEVQSKFYRKDSGLIVFDSAKSKWELKTNPNLVKGVVSFEKGSPVIGYFTANLYDNCKMVDHSAGTIPCINTELLLKNGYFEDVANGIYYNRKEVGERSYQKMITIRNEHNFTNKGYNIEENGSEFEQKKIAFRDYSAKPTKENIGYGKLLGTTTYGMEIETSAGNIPEHIQNRHGLVACRDGSIQSAEWVTVPMAGAKGVQSIVTLSKEMIKRCDIDINCSYHIHLGNISVDKLALTTLYILAYKIQDEIFKMFPYYKTDPRGIKRKNYCQKLKKMCIHPLVDFSKAGYNQYVDEVYERIFTFLSDGTPPDQWRRSSRQHPIAQKWNRHSRYYWLNLQNMIFSERETAEFRLHTATTNSAKMINWLFICNAIVRYAENNVQKILSDSKIKLSDVLDYYADHFKGNESAEFLSEYLKAYYKERCKVFKKDMESGDKVSNHDITNDKDFKFSYKGVALFQ